MKPIPPEAISKAVSAALEEDVGSGDITTESVIPAGMRARASLVTKEECVVCGLDVAEHVFRSLDPGVAFRRRLAEGSVAKPGAVIADIEGKAAALLTGERTALNFLQRLSGIATFARALSGKISGTGVKLLDTRKTTPGLRALEKYAVAAGGGSNHRFGLSDAVLIKDNHIALVGLEEAVRRAAKTGRKVEVEASTMDEVRRALAAGADIIMLDNMRPDQIREAIGIIRKRAVVEVSGGVDEGNISGIAALGPDWISVGRLTHSVRAADIAFEVSPLK